MTTPSSGSDVPKRASSGYWLWLGEHREDVVKALGGIKKGSEVSRKAGEMWKNLSPEEQAPYLERAKKEREVFAVSRQEKDRASAQGGDDGVRKKPTTPVFAFIQEKRSEIAAMPGVKSLGDISKKGAELFKELPEAEREQRTQRYNEELKSYNEWATTEEGQAARAGKRDAAAAKRMAKKEKQQLKEAKVARKEAKAAGVTAPKTAKSKAPSSELMGAPALKKLRVNAKPAEATPPIDGAVLKEAQNLGLEASMRNLAGRKEIIESGKSSKEILNALQNSKGLVNPAKRALLGA